jgi:hypothetical protein
MGHLEEDGSLSIPVDCIVEAVQFLGSQRLNEACPIFNGTPCPGVCGNTLRSASG